MNLHWPFDCAFQVGLTNSTVINEYRRAGTVLLWKQTRWDLWKGTRLNALAARRSNRTSKHNHKTDSVAHSLTWFMWLLFLLSRTEKEKTKVFLLNISSTNIDTLCQWPFMGQDSLLICSCWLGTKMKLLTH